MDAEIVGLMLMNLSLRRQHALECDWGELALKATINVADSYRRAYE